MRLPSVIVWQVLVDKLISLFRNFTKEILRVPEIVY